MSKAVPKLVQRFRARELQRLVDTSGLREPRRGGTDVFMQDINVKHVRMGTPLHNPFLPRPLFNQNANPNANAGTSGEKQVKERKKWAGPQYSLRRQADIVKAARASGTLHLLPPGPKLGVDELQEAKREVRRRAAAAKETAKAVQRSIAQAKSAKALLRAETTSVVVEETSITPQESVSTTTTLWKPRTTHRPWVLRRPSELARRRNSATAGYPGVVFHWTGKVPTKARKNLTIYAGRRRMFKGHKWERNLEKRRARIAVRMRDMDKRITRFKTVYKRRRAQPLKPATPRKKDSLPF